VCSRIRNDFTDNHDLVVVTYLFRVPIASYEYNSVTLAINPFVKFNDRIPKTLVLRGTRFKQVRQAAEVGSCDDDQKA
jgi:hypothetical protein